MLADLESALADVLGARLGAPFGGNVHRRPGPAPGTTPALLVGVTHADVLLPEFGAVRPEVVPGADDPRRVLRLRATVEVAVRATTAGGRDQEIAAVDAVAYELEDPSLRNGSALLLQDDPGFLLERLALLSVAAATADGEPAVVRAEAVGWFWPPGAEGETGEPIVAAHVRTALLPVALVPWPLDLRAGDQAIDLVLQVSPSGTAVLRAGEDEADAFGALAVRVVDRGGRPGAGTLTGGASGPDGARIVAVTGAGVTVTYTPPGDAAVDHLVVTMARPDTGGGVALGAELARFPLRVRS